MRGQVDLIDSQSCNDGYYKWIMNYQDHTIKFLHLRTLKSKRTISCSIKKNCFFSHATEYWLMIDDIFWWIKINIFILMQHFKLHYPKNFSFIHIAWIDKKESIFLTSKLFLLWIKFLFGISFFSDKNLVSTVSHNTFFTFDWLK